MKKQLQIILIGSLLLPSSTGVLLASNARCHAWVAETAIEVAQTVVEKKRHYSKKILAAWAVWRAQHPNARPIVRAAVSRRRPTVARDLDGLWLNCDATASTDDDAMNLVTEIATPDAPAPPPDLFADFAYAASLETPVADAAPTTDTPESAVGSPPMPPIFGDPGSPSLPPISGRPTSPTPPTDDPPTTGSSVPPPVPPPTTPPVAVVAEPSSLILLGTGIVATAGTFRRRRHSK